MDRLAVIPLALVLSAGTAFSAENNAASSTADEAMAIRPRETTSEGVTIARKEFLPTSLNATAYQASAVECARALANEKLKTADKEAIAEAVKRDPARSGAAFAACLDSKRYTDAAVRKGAIAAIVMANPSTKVVGKALGNTAIFDTDKETRDIAIKAIRERRDGMAMHTVMEHLSQAMDPDGLGIINEPLRDAALGALRDIGDKQVYQALLYYVTLEIRTGVAKLQNVDTKFITNSGDVNNGAVGQTTVNLPIELPTLELQSFQGSICVPAIASPSFALRKVTGEDFGKDLGKWRDWVNAQPDVRK